MNRKNYQKFGGNCFYSTSTETSGNILFGDDNDKIQGNL
jgi:hypothetical protein